MKPIKNILTTLGDPAGISGEVIVGALAALARPRSALAKHIRALIAARPANLYVAGDGNVLAHAKRIVRANLPVEVIDAFSTKVQTPTRIRLFELSKLGKADFRFGVPAYGREQLDYLDFAIEKARRGAVAAIVTAPMTKEAVAKVEPGFVGHTGYLAEELGVHDERMAFLTPEYLLALQTTHVPLVDVPGTSLSRASPPPSRCWPLPVANTTVASCRSPCSDSTHTRASTAFWVSKKIASSCRPWSGRASKAGPAKGPFPRIPSSSHG